MANAKIPASAMWAMPLARAWHSTGTNWPDVEQRLIANGLSQPDAHAVVMGIIEEELVSQQPVVAGNEEAARFIRLAISALIGAACLALWYFFQGGPSLMPHTFVVTGLALIWIPEIADVGDSGWGMSWIFTGWVLLLLYLAYRIYMALAAWIILG